MSIPSITRIARVLGDTSAISKPANVPRRFLNRGVGFLGGRLVGVGKKHFGLLGLVAIAEFFSGLQTAMRYQQSSPVWFGSMCNYAEWVDGGWTHHTSGLQVPPNPYFTAALKEVQAKDLGAGGFRFGPKLPGANASINTKVRSGVYEGQKFLGDMGQFYKDSSLSGLGSRFVRRETGRQVSGFLFNSLRQKRNPMEIFATRVLTKAKRNLEGFERSGMLRASLAWGFTEFDFIQASIQQAERAGARAGMTDAQIHNKLVTKTNVSGDRYTETFGIPDGAD